MLGFGLELYLPPGVLLLSCRSFNSDVDGASFVYPVLVIFVGSTGTWLPFT